MITLAVTVIKLITLRPLLEDRGHITKQSSVCHTHFCVRYSIKYFGEAVSRHSPAAPRGNCPALVTPLSCGPVLAVLVPLLSRPSSRWPGTATLRAGRPAGRWYDVRHDKQHCKIRADTVYRRRTCDARGHRFDRHIGRGSTTLGKLVTPSILCAAGVKPGR